MTPTNTRRVAITAALAAFGLGSFVSLDAASAQPRPRADSDYDNDGRNNRVDRDDDNDGVPDARDRDDDNDGIRDRRDRDDDNDGVRDRNDNDPNMHHGRRVIVQPRVHGEWTFNYRPLRYDDRHYDDLDAYDLDFDFNRDGFHTRFERDYLRFDRNGDGRLGYFERQAFWVTMANRGMFGPMNRVQAREMGSIAASFDADGSGRLTPYELRRLSRFIKARQLFIAFDRDRDGRLFRRETRGWMFNQFPTLDMNDDRRVTMRELRAAFLTSRRRAYWSWR